MSCDSIWCAILICDTLGALCDDRYRISLRQTATNTADVEMSEWSVARRQIWVSLPPPRG
jgi:hypothetical protein